MSYNEYNDLFLKCQDNGMYHTFTFDIVGSKKMDYKTRYETQLLLFELAGLMYLKLRSIEKRTQKRILIYDDSFVNLFDVRQHAGYGIKIEPIIFGDMLAITVYRDSITKNEMLELFQTCKKLIGLECDFHYADGYYETNEWSEGNSKYYRGYCLQLLSELHKPYNKEVKKLLKQRGMLDENKY